MKFMNDLRSLVLLVVAGVLAFGASDVHAFTRGDLDVYALAESFTWREFDDLGQQLLKESGPRAGVGIAYTHEFPSHLTLKPRIELNGGSVDYDGYTNGAPPAAVSTTTNYFGVKFEFDVAARIRPSQGFILEPFAGIGMRTWARNIEDSIAADGSFALGYTENWSTFYGRLGVKGEQSLGQKNSMFLLVGAKLPVSTTNYIDDRNVTFFDAITLEPGNKASLFAEAGVKLHFLKISAFYDTMRFKKSPVVAAFDSALVLRGFYQPRTESDMVGVRVGASF